MNVDVLVQTYPRLFHMAEDGSFPSIQAQGLLSTTALLDLYEISAEARTSIEGQRRPKSVTIKKGGLPDAVIRDNIPITDKALQKCLQDGIEPEEWYRTLNGKTFFWLHKKRLLRLLKAKAYRSTPQTLLTLDTATLVAAHSANILLSPINSGSTIMNPQPRGSKTFTTIEDYPYDERRKTRPVENALVELTIKSGVPDIMDHMIAAHRYADGKLTELWRRHDAAATDGPLP